METSQETECVTITPGGDAVLVLAYLTRPRTDAGPTDARGRALYGSDPECLTAEPRDIRDVSVLADKYGMVQRFRPMAAIWLGYPAATTSQPDHQAAWDLLVAAYLFRMEKEFFEISKFFIRNGAPFLKYALGTPDEHLGLKLGMAIESVRLANFTNHVDIGLYLGCFSTAQENFVERQPGCRFTTWHLW
ncbi:hypothetical protein HZS61_016659 [Fusarium oxysporum f. sp. conglutinans]|uniref:Uncharacterized protein n=1 Tax=Fusarium oxysporum f. sp. conglutinans TaxID=100902 RepID=A0A8H6GKS5_FUSOX|nr:hypothetical protein HZS61_016659 [Fusarium oxysporum f. sp. conglutinans]